MAISCVKAVAAARDPEFFRPNVEGYGTIAIVTMGGLSFKPTAIATEGMGRPMFRKVTHRGSNVGGGIGPPAQVV